MKKDKSFNARNMLVLMFEMALVIVAVIGITFATSNMMGAGSSTIITFGDFNVDYLGKTEISFDNLEPISDSLVNYETVNDVIRLEFSIRGVDTNKNPEKLIYEVMVTDMNIDCSLLNEYTKWNLYKNGELLSNGNFSPEFDGNVLTDNFRLTEEHQRLPLATEEYDNYVLIIWISESCDDLSTCEWVDQSNIVNSNIDMKVFIAVSGGDSVKYERVSNKDTTCVNKPVMYDGMIPVYYDSGFWRVADKTNFDKEYSWYDYDNSEWANVVFVNNEQYKDSEVGTPISENDIVDYYVWIPRFKYKLWNDTNTIDSYNAMDKGIDIVFESGVNSTGNIKCSSELCEAKANKYLTHPAFSNDLRGVWVNKYEISEIKTFDEYKTLMNDLGLTYNINADSHMISNLEWGSILYLSHSKYGLCKDYKCDRTIDSTTNNYYGVYGIYEGNPEYTIGDILLGSATKEFNLYNYINKGEYMVRGDNTTNISSRNVLVQKRTS